MPGTCVDPPPLHLGIIKDCISPENGADRSNTGEACIAILIFTPMGEAVLECIFAEQGFNILA
jgi:hypothetical protein